MKKLLFSILFIFTSFLVSAQEEPKKKESFADEFNREIKSIGKLNYKDYPMTIGIYGGPYFHTGSFYGLDFGGGAGIKFKFNFNKFLAISADLGYTYASGKENSYYNVYTYTSTSHMCDIRIMGVLQYETKKDKSGFVPWLGTGPVIAIASTTQNSKYNYSDLYGSNTTANAAGGYLGYIVALGFRYNFKKAYTGLNFDYTIAAPGKADVSGIRLNAEFGYRF